MKNYQISPERVAEQLGSDLQAGLSSSQVEKKREIFGENILPKPSAKSFFSFLGVHLKDYGFLALLSAAFASLLVYVFNFKYLHAVSTLILIVLSLVFCVIKAALEFKGSNTVLRISQCEEQFVLVMRDGAPVRVKRRSLLPGDVILLRAGDIVPADGRIVAEKQLRVDERILSRESVSVEKHDGIISGDNHSPEELYNMLFANTALLSGSCKMIVTEIGEQTLIYRRRLLLSLTENEKSGFRQQLFQMSKILVLPMLLVCFLIILVSLIQGKTMGDSMLLGVTLFFVTAPISFTSLVLFILGLGVKRFSRSGMLVKNLNTSEALAEVSVICADKTGTLTSEDMDVAACCVQGEILPVEKTNYRKIAELIFYASMCNDSNVFVEKSKLICSGDATECAILKTLLAMGQNKSDVDVQYPRMGSIPFDGERKCMSSIHVLDGRNLVIVKGAPETIFSKCLDTENLDQIRAAESSMSASGLRVLAVAVKEIDVIPSELFFDEIESDLCFIGLIGIKNAPRKETLSALSSCKYGGIRTIMFTEDHPNTARAVAEEMGILAADDLLLDGNLLEDLSDDEFEKAVHICNVYVRISPRQKKKIVKCLQKSGHIVMVSGDSVSDVPALESADIACAVSKGTDLTKSVADIVLDNNRFSSLVRAVGIGRGVCTAIKRTISFFLGVCIGELFLTLITKLLFFDLPLKSLSLLWLNLLFLILSVGLGMEGEHPDIFAQPPHDRKSSLITSAATKRLLLHSMILIVVCLLSFLTATEFRPYSNDVLVYSVGQTATYVVLGLSQIFFAFSARSARPLFKIGFASNRFLILESFLVLLLVILPTLPGVSALFGFGTLNLGQWILCVVLSICPTILNEIVKIIKQRR